MLLWQTTCGTLWALVMVTGLLYQLLKSSAALGKACNLGNM